MKTIKFNSDSAQRIYDNYIKSVGKNISILSEEDKLDTLMEINSHIYEAIQQENEKDEVANILNITEKLGTPEDYLAPLIAEKKIRQASRTFNPKHVWQALRFNFSKGFVYVIISLLYLLLSVFGLLIVAKIVIPSNIGLFYQGDSFQAFGFLSDPEGMTEILGFWFIPLAIVSAIIFYILITLLFRLRRKH
jgi:uncharacterized membrane protein